jgi:DNA invertase Pin-like site-specific DNA recombinase
MISAESGADNLLRSGQGPELEGIWGGLRPRERRRLLEGAQGAKPAGSAVMVVEERLAAVGEMRAEGMSTSDIATRLALHVTVVQRDLARLRQRSAKVSASVG